MVFGESASWEDPVKYSFTHGGKDGFPYPVDKEVYDNSINTMRDAIDQAKLKKDEKMKNLCYTINMYMCCLNLIIFICWSLTINS